MGGGCGIFRRGFFSAEGPLRVCRGRLEGDKVYGRSVNQMTSRKRNLKCEGWSNIFFDTTNTLFLRSEA